MGDSAACAPMGREFSVGDRRGGLTRRGPGRVVGGIYAANTFGAIIGALGVSLALIPWVGTLIRARPIAAGGGRRVSGPDAI